MLNGLGLKIKSAGGESTLSVNKKSMFPDVLLYEDEAQTKILQGWELKMPDVLITDETLIADATRKAKALGLNSFVIWNFTYGKLFIQNNKAFLRKLKYGMEQVIFNQEKMLLHIKQNGCQLLKILY